MKYMSKSDSCFRVFSECLWQGCTSLAHRWGSVDTRWLNTSLIKAMMWTRRGTVNKQIWIQFACRLKKKCSPHEVKGRDCPLLLYIYVVWCWMCVTPPSCSWMSNQSTSTPLNTADWMFKDYSNPDLLSNGAGSNNRQMPDGGHFDDKECSTVVVFLAFINHLDTGFPVVKLALSCFGVCFRFPSSLVHQVLSLVKSASVNGYSHK